ncbi:MAG: glutathione peroxidase [Tenuifilaceae bacterium]|jgi:glutathione peroxidase|nr:glutathione peroxidase [Tenuifilaceae bacterium]
MKASVIVLFSVMLFTVGAMAQSKSFYDFTVTDINGKEFPLSQLKDKKVMVVNTASKCGFTKQYKTLEEVYKTYGGDKFIIIGFPANNFLSQEPGTNDEIKEFCTKNYGVTFPMMSKISVKGDDMHPLYKWLTTKSLNGVMDSEVGWNFQKYLIDENGNLVDMVKPRELPDSKRIIEFITGK